MKLQTIQNCCFAKGQKILEDFFFLSSIPPKNQQKMYPISAPVSKKWLNQKIKAIYFVKKNRNFF